MSLNKHTPILVMCLIFKLCKMFEFELSELFFTFFFITKANKKKSLPFCDKAEQVIGYRGGCIDLLYIHTPVDHNYNDV